VNNCLRNPCTISCLPLALNIVDLSEASIEFNALFGLKMTEGRVGGEEVEELPTLDHVPFL
jgi:hypothetical protein